MVLFTRLICITTLGVRLLSKSGSKEIDIAGIPAGCYHVVIRVSSRDLNIHKLIIKK